MSKNSSNLSKKFVQKFNKKIHPKNSSKKIVIGIHTIDTKVTQKLKNSKKA